METNFIRLQVFNRFLGTKSSMEKLELLDVVWSLEHFENYLHGITFGIVSDHKALERILKSNKGNKQVSSRFNSWV